VFRLESDTTTGPLSTYKAFETFGVSLETLRTLNEPFACGIKRQCCLLLPEIAAACVKLPLDSVKKSPVVSFLMAKMLSSTWIKSHIGLPALRLLTYCIVVVVALLTSAYPRLSKPAITLVPLISTTGADCVMLRVRVKLPDVTVTVAERRLPSFDRTLSEI